MSDDEIKNPKVCNESNMPNHSMNDASGTSDLKPQADAANEGCALRFLSFLLAMVIVGIAICISIYDKDGLGPVIFSALIAFPFINYAFHGTRHPEKQKSHSSKAKTDTGAEDIATAAMIASMAGDDSDATSESSDGGADDGGDAGCDCDDGCDCDGCDCDGGADVD